MKSKLLLLLLLPVLPVLILYAGNPIVPPGMYMADGSAHQWPDGRLYIYGSRDVDPGYYCSHHYDILSTGDMINWTVHRDVFSSRGSDDKVPYSDSFLYAPDCMYRDGKYYLYYCLSGSGEVEGVAVGDSPIGPFGPGEKIEHANHIDPAVFIDDDGEAYYLWGQFTGRIAKMNADMKSIDPATIKDDLITEEEHFFHEGIQMFKRNGIYYLAYTDISRHGMATSIGYAMSDSPYGPFVYKGVIIDNFGCDPNTWNNHGSVFSFDGNWYVCYHRSTHGVVSMRKACIEPIRFNDDGTIDQVEMTTQGAGPPLNAFTDIDAERACFLTGSVRITKCAADNEELSRIEDLNTAAYKYLDFTRSPETVTVRVAPQAGGTITVFANNLCAPVLAVIDIPAGDGTKYKEITAPVTTDITGVHPVYMRFHGEDGRELFRVDRFRFD